MQHKIIHKPSINFDKRPQNAAIEYLIVHYTACDLDFSLKILTSPEYGVSAHYVISPDGIIYQLVQDEHRAWHAGVSSWQNKQQLNINSIGIELVYAPQQDHFPTYPQKQMDAFLELTKYLQKNHQIPPQNILGHSDIAIGRKVDPGPRFDWEMCAQEGIGLSAFNCEYKTPQQLSRLAIKEKLSAIGYGLNELNPLSFQQTVHAFKLHFCPEEISNELSLNFLSKLEQVYNLAQNHF